MSKLVWIDQYYMWQPHECTDTIHYAHCKYGTFEIYDDGDTYLLSSPRKLKRHAELFSDLNEAKEAAENHIPVGPKKPWFFRWIKDECA